MTPFFLQRGKFCCLSFPHIIMFMLLILFSWLLACNSDESSTGVANTPDTTSQFSANDFQVATDCQSCHPVHYQEWSGSMHAYAAKDPVMAALNLKGQLAYVNSLDQDCVGCHTPIGSRAGETPWGEFNYDSLSAVAKEGIGCDLCHSISSVSAIQNSSILLSPGDVKYGSMKDFMSNDFHKSEYHPLYENSAYCGSCHDIVTRTDLALETTFSEWQAGGLSQTGKTCQQCHMPTYTGPAALGGPDRTVHSHAFIGVDVALIDHPQQAEQAVLVAELLRSALTVTLNTPSSVIAGDSATVTVDMLNDKTGHDVPSGATFLRQMWIHITVHDGTGNLIYESGQLDVNNDLMNENSSFPERDNDLYLVQSKLYRADGIQTLLTWEAHSMITNGIKAGETKRATYKFAVPTGTLGPLTVDAVLSYRMFPPHVIRDLALDSLLPIPVFEMANKTQTITIQ